MGAIVMWDFQKEKQRAAKGSFRFHLPGKSLVLKGKQMRSKSKKDIKEEYLGHI